MTNILTNQAVFELLMPNGGEDGRIHVWVSGGELVRTFTGKPYSAWVAGETSEFREIHDSLNQMHLEDLHVGKIVKLQPNARDYETINRLMNAPSNEGTAHTTARNRVLRRQRTPSAALPARTAVRLLLRRPDQPRMRARPGSQIAKAAARFSLVPASRLAELRPN